MNDCSNAEIRDQLPDLIHERLPVSARAIVLEHLGGCVDCREEVELLRAMHSVFVTRAPRVDVTAVVNALPKPAARHAPVAAPRRIWGDWRIAAAVTFLAVGGASVALVNREDTTGPSFAEFVVDSPARPGVSQSRETVTVATTDEGASGGLQMSGRLADLNDEELQTLLNDIDQMKAVPITDPEPVNIKVDSRLRLPEDEGI